MARFRLVSATNEVETGKKRLRWQDQQTDTKGIKVHDCYLGTLPV